ncbi:MAG: hypothetical protein RBS40_02150 [Rhodocyclaceae bacterium]|nr:hypothetical protein [Rhodocyclaceae bacterium]
MENMGKVATWMELASGRWQSAGGSGVRVHPVGSAAAPCFALSVDGRWLHAGDGRLTLFHGLGSAVRFLRSAAVTDFEEGAPADLQRLCAGPAHCLMVHGKRGLVACSAKEAGCCLRSSLVN